MARYNIEYPVSRNGKRITEGAITLDDDNEARGLLKVGAISGPIKGATSKDGPDTHPEKLDAGMAGGATSASPAPAEGEAKYVDAEITDRERTLRAYLADFKAGDKGRPKITVACKETGFKDLSAEEITAAWQALD